MGRPLESRLHFDYYSNNHLSQLRSTDYLDFCFMAFLSWVNDLDQESKKNFGATRVSVHRISYPKGVELLLRETARKSCPDP